MARLSCFDRFQLHMSFCGTAFAVVLLTRNIPLLRMIIDSLLLAIATFSLICCFPE